MRLLILQRLQSVYAFILHYALTLSPFVRTQRMHVFIFTTCTAGKKRTEEFGTKCILVKKHRERIGQRVGRACAAKELSRRAATFRCRSCRNVAEHWREIIAGQKRANARVGPPAAFLGVSFFFEGCAIGC